MPPIQTPFDSEQPTPQQEPLNGSSGTSPQPSPAPDAPLSFVPHDELNQPIRPMARIRTNRYGELEEHELIRLLDTIEDERARGRFRESIYISLFFWLVVVWFIFYGPRVLWHAPVLVNPMDVLNQREVTQLNMPVLSHPMPRAAVKPAPKPTLDNHTLERLRAMTHETLAPAPLPSAPQPSSAAPAPPPPTPRPAPPVVAEAPTPQPATRPDFNTGNGTAGDNIQNAMRNGARSRSGSTEFSASPSNPLGGGVDILSDTQGVDFDPYLRRILADIKRNWLPLIPEEAEPPLSKQGETYIRFTILPDGNIAAMHLDGSTHDDAINHSCWSAITSEGQFPPLPSQFHGPNLELRIHFLVNKDIGQ